MDSFPTRSTEENTKSVSLGILETSSQVETSGVVVLGVETTVNLHSVLYTPCKGTSDLSLPVL